MDFPEIVLSLLASFVAGLFSKNHLLLLLQKMDAFLYAHWTRYKSAQKRTEAERLERRAREAEAITHAMAAGKPLYSDDLAFAPCRSCYALLRGRSWQDENGNCSDCARILSSRSEREITIQTALLQARAINSLNETLRRMHEHEARRDGRPVLR